MNEVNDGRENREERNRKEVFRENFQNGQRRKGDFEKKIKLPQKGRSGNKNWSRYLDEDGDGDDENYRY